MLDCPIQAFKLGKQHLAKEVRQAGFEPATRCLEGSRSIRLSYWRSVTIVHGVDHASATLRSQSARVMILINIPNGCG